MGQQWHSTSQTLAVSRSLNSLLPFFCMDNYSSFCCRLWLVRTPTHPLCEEIKILTRISRRSIILFFEFTIIARYTTGQYPLGSYPPDRTYCLGGRVVKRWQALSPMQEFKTMRWNLVRVAPQPCHTMPPQTGFRSRADWGWDTLRACLSSAAGDGGEGKKHWGFGLYLVHKYVKST